MKKILLFMLVISCSARKVEWEFNINNPKNLYLVKEIADIKHKDPWQIKQKDLDKYLGR
jgi:hypothetical protein